MDFGAIKTSVEAIKEGAFGCNYSRDIYSSVNGKWYKKLWKKSWLVEKYCSKELLFKLLWC